MRMRKYMGGVTLLELMIVVVIIGILTAIAYPNYREFAARAKRTEARALLMEIAVNQERWYLQNNTDYKHQRKVFNQLDQAVDQLDYIDRIYTMTDDKELAA